MRGSLILHEVIGILGVIVKHIEVQLQLLLHLAIHFLLAFVLSSHCEHILH